MKKRIAIALTFCMFSLLILWMAFDNYFANTRSKVPDPTNGRIYQINSHGAIAYLDRWEYFLLHALFVGGILCAVAGGTMWRASERDALKRRSSLK